MGPLLGNLSHRRQSSTSDPSAGSFDQGPPSYRLLPKPVSFCSVKQGVRVCLDESQTDFIERDGYELTPPSVNNYG